MKAFFIGVVSIVFSCMSFATEYKIGLAVWSGYPSSVNGFKQGLAESGLAEGKEVEFITGKIGADKALQTEVAKSFKEKQLDLVYSLTTPGTLIVKEYLGEETPIVYSVVTYPADAGIIESFEYSGNNLVGTSNYVETSSYLKILNRILPSAKRVAIFHRDKEPNSTIQSVNLYRVFKRDGKSVTILKPTNIAELKTMAETMVGKVDIFVTTTDTLMQSGGEEVLIEVSLAEKIPILSSNKKGIEVGVTFGPVADFF